MFANATPNWTETLSAISSAIMALTALAGVLYAAWNFKGWLREIRGRDEYGFALRILQAVYGLRNAIDEYRDEWGLGYERNADMRRVHDAHQALTLPVRESEALFGGMLAHADRVMRACVLKLRTNHRKYKRMNENEKYYERLSENARMEICNVIEVAEEDCEDEFGNAVAAAVRLFEDAMKPKLKG